MAQKIITTENGEVITKTSKQVKTERRIRKFQKYVSVATFAAVILVISSMCVFAADDNAAPDGVKTSTMSSLANIIWWLVRIAIAAIGGIPAVIKIVQGQSDENPRDRNAGIATLLITAACFGATFAIDSVIGI
ncbi:MAG: hypothetical protein PUG48_10530 [Clostridia bacterium]|nr:hypothetical protein [Clostridia bacterium]